MASKKNDNAQMMTSDFNMQKLTTREMEKHVGASIAMGSNVALFGRRGSGKTEICKQQIKKSGMKEVYINLSVLERVDLGGFPDMLSSARSSAFVSYLLPKFYEAMLAPPEKGQKEAQGVVALLDEVDKADPSLWAPLLEFVQFKSINGLKLPNLKSVLMTGNLIVEGGSRPSAPLLDRAEKYLVGADVQSWMDWAGRDGNIHPAITAFINDHPSELFGDPDLGEKYADPSPRGWTGASDILYRGEEMGVNSEVLNAKVAGRVGKQAGLKYHHYYEHYQQLLPLVAELYEGKSILAKYKKLEPTKQIVLGIIVGTRMANKFDEIGADTPKNKLPKEVDIVGKFLSEIQPENSFIVLRNQIQVDRMSDFDLDEHPAWEGLVSGINDRINGT